MGIADHVRLRSGFGRSPPFLGQPIAMEKQLLRKAHRDFVHQRQRQRIQFAPRGLVTQQHGYLGELARISRRQRCAGHQPNVRLFVKHEPAAEQMGQATLVNKLLDCRPCPGRWLAVLRRHQLCIRVVENRPVLVVLADDAPAPLRQQMAVTVESIGEQPQAISSCHGRLPSHTDQLFALRRHRQRVRPQQPLQPCPSSSPATTSDHRKPTVISSSLQDLQQPRTDFE